MFLVFMDFPIGLYVSLPIKTSTSFSDDLPPRWTPSEEDTKQFFENTLAGIRHYEKLEAKEKAAKERKARKAKPDVLEKKPKNGKPRSGKTIRPVDHRSGRTRRTGCANTVG